MWYFEQLHHLGVEINALWQFNMRKSDFLKQEEDLIYLLSIFTSPGDLGCPEGLNNEMYFSPVGFKLEMQRGTSKNVCIKSSRFWESQAGVFWCIQDFHRSQSRLIAHVNVCFVFESRRLIVTQFLSATSVHRSSIQQIARWKSLRF